MSDAGGSQEPAQKKRKRERDPNQLKMNTSNSGLNWWLVKVPKYLGEKWLSSPSSEVGKIEIRRDKGRTEVNFKLNEHLANQGETRTPIDHKLRLSAPSKSETIGILCRSKKFEDGQEIEERSVEGTIVQDLHKGFGNDVGELSLKHGSFGELTKLADQLEKVKEEPELFADFLKRFDAEVTAMQISFGRLTKISKNISKAQEATVTQAMEYSEGLKKVERLKNMIISTNNEITEKTHQPIVEIFNRLHKSGNELMAEAEELEKFNHVWLKEEFDALQKVIKPGSKLVIDEMQNSEGMSFRLLILKSHLERYERGLEGNRYQAVNIAYEVMLDCDKFLKERFDELEALLTDDGAEEFKKKALKQTAELGRLLKTVSRAGADLEWIK
ncbi:Oidioi.mRNA.OKI2018_I69.chr2.g6181.t1.cds [Oikopleura dioica]|uniref:Oidioi.mRNA.OKI2018_I69.chr2.g6181.t1.cds n=1 Tax=Oikopleura dioica TaxID=34765 RepID=A0ABN7T8N8_OIKDI|nr:Oidioi.mRNA.OKI2018_I69.chr2.g6181.t1.cds [Oikopleura dioica]